MRKLITGKCFLGQKSPLTKVSLDNCPMDICLLGKRSPYFIVSATLHDEDMVTYLR